MPPASGFWPRFFKDRGSKGRFWPRVSSSFGCARRLVAAVEQWWRKWLTVQTREGGERTPATMLPWNGMDHGVHESGEDAETVLCVSAEKMEVETCSCCADSENGDGYAGLVTLVAAGTLTAQLRVLPWLLLVDIDVGCRYCVEALGGAVSAAAAVVVSLRRR
ncbi:hypothetical protein DEO72_LG7g802 [Vigna unguiculata]|uniref:Uncharacterized protein n=1 Tax=Vigna unguiculata TaxID=3917 RepID=A0A4D6MFJ0_VIGUN|nr:hypothetical protein DEO72_LG7g802 [Vigna unguiculata]